MPKQDAPTLLIHSSFRDRTWLRHTPLLISLSIFVAACSWGSSENAAAQLPTTPRSRLEAIPAEAVKITHEQDKHPPVVHSNDWSDPIPLEGSINTAGAEDSPFISPDGSSLLFFFTPDVDVPVEKQLLDGVTGIYLSNRIQGGWGPPDRVILQEDNKHALDGCGFFDGETLWFCSAREGYTGLHWFKADPLKGGWTDPAVVDFDAGYEVGEFHIYTDELYFHSMRPGGQGDMDLWMSRSVDDVWQPPENLSVLNTEVAEGYPFITADGRELWFNRWYQGTPAIYRSIRVDGEWQDPELILSQFAGEPTLDPQGNIYFVHHFFQDDTMIEADIYIAYRK